MNVYLPLFISRKEALLYHLFVDFCVFQQEMVDHALCRCKRARKIYDNTFKRVASDIAIFTITLQITL